MIKICATDVCYNGAQEIKTISETLKISENAADQLLFTFFKKLHCLHHWNIVCIYGAKIEEDGQIAFEYSVDKNANKFFLAVGEL